jgi:AhpD family alkylhydroperoxidase
MPHEHFPLHDPDSAPEASRAALQRAKQSLGMVPNLERVMASAPTLLAGYVELWALFDQTSLSAVERQVVYQTANLENECDYCVPWHSKLSERAGMSPADVSALREGRPLSTLRLEALRLFTQALIRCRGKILQADLEAFLSAGWTPAQALEVILGLAVKTMSNYTNAIAGTPLEPAMARYAWRKPRIPMRVEAGRIPGYPSQDGGESRSG